MKANELMIGDWLCIEDANTRAKYYCRVKKIGAQFIYFDCDEVDVNGLSYDCFFPIPLTPEILEKNGFKKDINGDFELVEEEYGVRVVRRGDVYAFTLVTTRGGITDMFRFTLHRVGPFSVHWLQHALRLCGIEKEITIE